MAGATAEFARAIPELTDREKTFLCVTADVCQASLGLAFTAHVRAGLAAGVSTSDIRELLRFVSYDCGYHAATAGIERIAELEAELGIPRPDAEPLAPELLSTGSGRRAQPAAGRGARPAERAGPALHRRTSTCSRGCGPGTGPARSANASAAWSA